MAYPAIVVERVAAMAIGRQWVEARELVKMSV
jgi:hypothetical protein